MISSASIGFARKEFRRANRRRVCLQARKNRTTPWDRNGWDGTAARRLLVKWRFFANNEPDAPRGVLLISTNNKARSIVNKASTISFVVAAAGIFVANGVSNTMKRLVYNSSGKSFRLLSMQLVREYRALHGQDRNYWAYCLAWLAFASGMVGFALFPK